MAGVVPVVFVERFNPADNGNGVAGEQIGSQADIGADSGFALYFFRFALDQRFARSAAYGIFAGCSANLVALNVNMFIRIRMAGFAELKFERDVFAGIAVQVETECVESFFVQEVRHRQAGIGVDRHGHHRRAGGTLEEIEIADVEAGIFLRQFGVEMV